LADLLNPQHKLPKRAESILEEMDETCKDIKSHKKSGADRHLRHLLGVIGDFSKIKRAKKLQFQVQLELKFADDFFKLFKQAITDPFTTNWEDFHSEYNDIFYSVFRPGKKVLKKFDTYREWCEGR
jgi:hypothetical protein